MTGFTINNKHTNGLKDRPSRIEIPKIELPKGGGALRAIDEKFQVNSSNGTSTFSVPLPFQQGRSGFGPGLALSYDSGAGMGVFGTGWSLSLPSVVRGTGKRLPEYDDMRGSDDFQLSGFEDLVPAMRDDGSADSFQAGDYWVQRYRPRTESAYARIERIHKRGEPAAYWRMMTGDGTTTVYGRTRGGRIADPEASDRVFRWLPEWQFDDCGNCLEYRYKPEDLSNVPERASEALRLEGATPLANLHIKHILYGNRQPYHPAVGGADFDPAPPSMVEYFFRALLDYGEHPDNRDLSEQRPWMARGDPWSDRRPGFDLRTNRLCRRIIFYNRFEELDHGAQNPAWVPIRGLEFGYSSADFSRPAALPVSCEKLLTVSEVGYRPDCASGVSRTTLPPMHFTYQPSEMSTTIGRSGRDDLPNAPDGLMGEVQPVDLYGDGVPGLLTETANLWLYAKNMGHARFGRAHPVWSKPSFTGLGAATLQIRDLDADGSTQIVIEQPGLEGYFERNCDSGTFSPMVMFPRPARGASVDSRKLIDLDGDGRPEIVIAGDDSIHYLESSGRDGYGRWLSAPFPPGEGPRRLLVAGEDEGIHLADMTGSGMSDLVRVRPDSISYWPNLGHGRFGPLIEMDRCPVLDAPDSFDPRRVQFADLGGTGAADLVYDAVGGPMVALNFSGNGWGPVTRFPSLAGPTPDTRLMVMDLMAEGTPCLVRSSSMSADAGAPLVWADLYRGQRPNLLQTIDNGAGKTVTIRYKSSLQFQLEDEARGRPWLTRLPFPVHCVTRTETRESVTNSLFVSEYRYRHGYFDAADREFRGFAFVEQVDSEDYSTFAGSEPGNAPAPDLHEATIRTRTWFHTGAFPGWSLPERLRAEFFPLPASAVGLEGGVQEEPSAGPPEDRIEAHRALKGQMLRTEVCALDSTPDQDQPYRIGTFSYITREVQPRGSFRYGVHQVLESESAKIHIERDNSDPLIRHHLILAVDDQALPLRTAQVAYARAAILAGLDAAIATAQSQTHVIVRTFGYVPDISSASTWRRRSVCQNETFQLTGAAPATGRWKSDELDKVFLAAKSRDYSASKPSEPTRRLIEMERVLLADDTDPLMPALPLGTASRCGIVHESYRLAFDATLRKALYGADIANGDLTAAHYRAQADLELAGLFPPGEPDRWWTASGHVEYPASPPDAFFRPVAYVDPVGQRTEVREYRDYFLLIDRIRDQAGNDVTVQEFDFRFVAPREIKDINGNISAVSYDCLGLVAGSALMGKGAEGGSLASFDPDLSDAQVDAFWADPLHQARTLLGDATTRVVSDHHQQPNWSAVISRAMHAADEAATGQQGQLQIAFDFTDGLGRVALRKLLAEPGEALVLVDGSAVTVDSGTAPRWVGSGRKVFNNKGDTVLEFNPYFALEHGYDDADALVATGFSMRNHYDPFGRLIAVDHPDGSREETRIAAWSSTKYDRNDLAGNSHWRADRVGGGLGAAAKAAALQTDLHADTPTVEHFDGLGHLVARVDHNRFRDLETGLPVDEKLTTHFVTDVQGNLLQVTDPRGIEIVAHAYDMAGTRAVSTTADAGRRWRLSDCLGKMNIAGDARNNRIRIVYDAMQRPVEFRVRSPGTGEALRERHSYGTATDISRNANGRLVEVLDSAGSIATPRYDFQGNVLETQRRFLDDPRLIPDWDQSPMPELGGALTTRTVYDALNRLTRLTAPDGSVEEYDYNENNMVEMIGVSAAGRKPSVLVENVDYDAKGQRRHIRYGNGVETTYRYEVDTDRLSQISLRRLSDGARLQHLDYTYDAVGNVTVIADGANPGLFFKNVWVEPGGVFSYDALYRLTSATGREHAAANVPPDWADAARSNLPHKTDGNALQRFMQSYGYDRSGNLVKIRHLAGRGNSTNAWTRRMAYKAVSNRLDTATVGAAPPDTFSYDLHGNTTAMPHLANMEWDEDNRLVYVLTNAGNRIWYSYDSEGNRVRKFIEHRDGSTEDRIYVGRWERIERRRADKSLRVVRESLHVLDGHSRIAMIERRVAGNDAGPASLTCYQFANALGTVLLELDGTSGQVLSYEEFHPWGTTALQSATTLRRAVPKRYRFTGKERDLETGLYYHGARFYAPWLGRWTSPDPAGAADGYNLYVYSGNRPVGSSDPTGMWELPSWRTVAVVSAVIVVGAVATVATAGAAAPVVAGAVASVGLSGTAATVATGVAVGAVSGAVAGAASGAAGEATRQTVNSRVLGLGTEEFSGRAVLRDTGSGAVTGAAIGAGFGGLVAGTTTATGAGIIGGAGKVAAAATGAVVPAAIRSVAAGAARRVASAATRAVGTTGGQLVKGLAEAVGKRVAALEQAATQRGAALARRLPLNQRGVEAVNRMDATGNYIAGTFDAQPSNIAMRGLRPDEAASKAAGRGISARNPDGPWTAAEHVANIGPGSGGASANSPWIPTSRRMDVARAYQREHGIAVVDLNRVSSIKTEVWRTAPRVSGELGLPYHRSIWAQEVTIFRSISAEAILTPKVMPLPVFSPHNREVMR